MTTSEGTYDSTGDTLKHSLRVGALMVEMIKELAERSVRHDLSKTEDPELATFNEFTPKLRTMTYGSDEYKACLVAMGPALEHHYRVNAHHPEHRPRGINGMTLVDLVEMLADWKAAGERHPDGDLARSLIKQRDRFDISDQLLEILHNTAVHFGWLPAEAEPPAPRPKTDSIYERAYFAIGDILFKALGGASAGEGLAADARLLAQRYADLKAAVLAPGDGTGWPRCVEEIEAAPLRCEHGMPVDEDCAGCSQIVRAQFDKRAEAGSE